MMKMCIYRGIRRIIFVGIDTGKDYLDVIGINIHGHEVLPPCRFTQDKEGFKQFLQTVKKVEAQLDSEIRFGIESTGVFHIGVYDYLDTSGYQVRVFNGLEVRAFKKTRIRKTETDKIAAKAIANALRFCFDPEKRSPLPKEWRNLRELCRARGRLVKEQTRMKNQLGRNLDLIFPGLTKLFAKKMTKQFLRLLEHACTPAKICEMGEEELMRLLSARKAKSVLKVAQNAQGAEGYDKAVSIEIQSQIRRLRVNQEEIEQMEREINKEFDSIDSVIITIKCIGPITGAIILTEIGDIENFTHPKQIVALAGLDSIIKASGRFRGEYKISKCGSKYLRTALYQAAFTGARCNPVLHAYYTKMRSKGKTHRDALTCCARKLCHIVYSVLKNNKPFYVPSKFTDSSTESS